MYEESLHILMIEDDQRLAQLTSRYLASHGVVVSHVAPRSGSVSAPDGSSFSHAIPEPDADGDDSRNAADADMRSGVAPASGQEPPGQCAQILGAEQSIQLEVRINPPWLEMWVIDEGIGIEPDDLSMLTTPFFRTDRSRTRTSGGVGLGLTLARRIVEAHRGTLTFDSQAGLGTRVCVALPISAPASSSECLS